VCVTAVAGCAISSVLGDCASGRFDRAASLTTLCAYLEHTLQLLRFVAFISSQEVYCIVGWLLIVVKNSGDDDLCPGRGHRRVPSEMLCSFQAEPRPLMEKILLESSWYDLVFKNQDQMLAPLKALLDAGNKREDYNPPSPTVCSGFEKPLSMWTNGLYVG
jgi:hypothetical protein